MTYSIFSINEQAVAKMQEGDFKASEEHLLHGISILEEEFECSRRTSGMDCDDNRKSRMMSYTPATKNTRCCSDNGNNVFEAYELPMQLTLLASEDTSARCLTEQEFNGINVILLYNHGLCLHLHGLSTGDEIALEESLIVYETAIDLISLLEDEPFYFLVEMALLNNYGQISSYFCHSELVHECLVRMHAVLYSATNAWKTNAPREFAHFAQNIVFNLSQHCWPAPAA